MSRCRVRIETSSFLASSRPDIRPCACSKSTADSRRSALMNTPWPFLRNYCGGIMTWAVIYERLEFMNHDFLTRFGKTEEKRLQMKLTDLFLAQLEREAEGT